MAKQKVNVKWREQYIKQPSGEFKTRYTVYLWIGHPLLGEVRGTRETFATKSAAQKRATFLRKAYNK